VDATPTMQALLPQLVNQPLAVKHKTGSALLL
jgi:hypothetical protein